MISTILIPFNVLIFNIHSIWAAINFWLKNWLYLIYIYLCLKESLGVKNKIRFLNISMMILVSKSGVKLQEEWINNTICQFGLVSSVDKDTKIVLILQL